MGLQTLYVSIILIIYLLINFLGHYDATFSKTKTFHYDASTLKNAENHLRDIHMLEEQGDIWRAKPVAETVQASRVVDRTYDEVIPFRQLEFKNAFLE